jgi:hypothetical protein
MQTQSFVKGLLDPSRSLVRGAAFFSALAEPAQLGAAASNWKASHDQELEAHLLSWEHLLSEEETSARASVRNWVSDRFLPKVRQRYVNKVRCFEKS